MTRKDDPADRLGHQSGDLASPDAEHRHLSMLPATAEPSAASWFDDPVEAGVPAVDDPEYTQRTNSLRVPSPPRRPRRTAILVGALALVTIGIVGTAIFVISPSPQVEKEPVTTPAGRTTTSSAATTQLPAASGQAVADFTWCDGLAPGEPVTAESTDPGLDAIWRFENAFYTSRDAVAARSVGTADAVMASVERLALGIDALDRAVEFCVLATESQPGVYDVTVFERGPGIDSRTSEQRIATVLTEDGVGAITSITRR